MKKLTFLTLMFGVLLLGATSARGDGDQMRGMGMPPPKAPPAAMAPDNMQEPTAKDPNLHVQTPAAAQMRDCKCSCPTQAAPGAMQDCKCVCAGQTAMHGMKKRHAGMSKGNQMGGMQKGMQMRDSMGGMPMQEHSGMMKEHQKMGDKMTPMPADGAQPPPPAPQPAAPPMAPMQ
jgi:hypothetical protein